MKTDIEINNECKKKKIIDIAKKLRIKKSIISYGDYKAKISLDLLNKEKKGKLILVTSTNPTPYGEGKTTISLGINDALNKLGYKSIASLREPSLGPVFGIKGGATGGGYAQMVPMEDINLHFTGDFHAITSANNLLCAAIDNHIFHGNELDIKEITFKRCLDICDRSLRKVMINDKESNFTITAASEIMAIFCLAKDFEDLREKLSNIIIGYDSFKKPIYAKELKCIDSMLVLLKDAFMPNLVQSLENNPVIIHGGPFANIAHGCSSLVSTKIALKISDYVVTEAGFGSDLGGFKFLDIKCRNDIKPDVVVINTTIRGLKHNGYNSLNDGIVNLKYHILNMKKLCSNVIVALNVFDTDTEEEMLFIKDYCHNLEVKFNLCTSFINGSKGSLSLAKDIVELAKKENELNFVYELNDTLQEKIEKVGKEIYYVSEFIYSDIAVEKLKKFKNVKKPICLSKTQYSITDNPKLLGFPTNNTMNIRDIKETASFVIIYTGNIIDMPGMNDKPNYEKIKIKDNEISGLF